MLLCNRMSAEVYADILEEGTHGAMFGSEDEFEQTIMHYLTHEGARRRVVARAWRHVHAVHSYATRVEQLEEHIAHSELDLRREEEEPAACL